MGGMVRQTVSLCSYQQGGWALLWDGTRRLWPRSRSECCRNRDSVWSNEVFGQPLEVAGAPYPQETVVMN
jgi:hypothetical protein